MVRQKPVRSPSQQQQGPVDGVAALRVAELVGDDEPHLLLVEQVEQRGVDHDDRLVHADGHRVGDRVVDDVELGQLLDVEDPAHLGQQPVHAGELALVDADPGAEVVQPHPALVDEARTAP